MQKFFSHNWKRWIAGLVTILFLVGIYQIPAVHALMGNEEVGPGTSVAGQALQQSFADGNGLTEQYNFDGTTNDTSATGNNTTVTGTTTYVPGKFGKAFSFNGSTYLTPSSIMIPSAATAWSFSTWISPASFPNNPLLFQETAGLGTVEAYISGGPGGTNKTINLDIYNSGWTRLATTTSPIVLNQWTLVTITYSSTTAIIYINGAADGTATLNTIPSLSGATFNIAGTGSFTNYNGSMDDTRFYNRALTQAEVTNLYQGSTPVSCDQSCVGWWKLDDGIANTASTSAIDSSGNGHTATLHSFTYDILTNGWGTGVFGGGILESAGSTQYISASSIPTTSTMTVSAWVNPSSSFAAYARIFGTTNNGPVIGMNSNATIDYSIVNSGGTYSDFTGPKVTLGAWSNITMTLSGLILKIYLNGVLVGTSNTAFALSSGTFTAGIGSLPASASQVFNGLFDDVRIYNRSLRDYEVAALYNAGRSS